MTSVTSSQLDADPVEEPADESADGTDPSGPRPTRRPGRRIVTGLAVTVVLICAFAFLFPVIAAPVNADDRYWYLWVGWRAEGSVLEVFRWSWERLHVVTEIGRVNVLTQLERRLVYQAVMETAVATATPIVVYLALVKLALFAVTVLSGLALVRSLRWRDGNGCLVRVGRRTLYLAAFAAAAAAAVGAQAQAETRNGWTAYPVNTYGAAVLILGSVALLIWLTRLVAERSMAFAAVAVVFLVLLAVITGLSYELVFTAVPVAAAAFVVIPVTDAARRAAGRRAKLVTGAAYFGTFTAVFVAIRLYIADTCADKECYAGVTMSLGRAAARTALYNLLSAVPGAGGNELLADMDLVGWADRYPVGPRAWSVLVGVVVAVALAALWWARRPDPMPVAEPSDVTTDERGTRRAEGILLFIGAGLFLITALGTSAIMGLSMRAQDEIHEPGTLYRNAMITWTSLAFCAVLAVLAIGYFVPRPGGVVAWVALSVAVGVVGALTLPGNLMALRANRVGHQVVEAINWEVVQGDTGPGTDARRCELFQQSVDAIFPGGRRRLVENANLAFKHYHGRAFCSDPKYPGGPGWEPTWQVE